MCWDVVVGIHTHRDTDLYQRILYSDGYFGHLQQVLPSKYYDLPIIHTLSSSILCQIISDFRMSKCE